MKVAPQKLYSYEVYFNEMLGRWFAKFTSNKIDMSYEFPLVDGMPHNLSFERPTLSDAEQIILSLVFVQMVATVRAQQAQEAKKAAE